MAITYTVDASDLLKKTERLAKFPLKTRRAMANALNRGLNRVSTNVVKEVAKEYDVVQGQVKKTITRRRANTSNLLAEAIVSDKRLKLGSFKFRYKRNQQRSPVSVRVKKSNGFTTSNSTPALFAGRSKATGRVEIFRRDPSGQFDIEYPFTLSIPQMVENDKVYQAIAEDAADFIQKRFEHELEHQLRKTLGTV